MSNIELIYEYDDSSEREPSTAASVAELEHELRAERHAHEITRVERDLARLRIKQFERLATRLACSFDVLERELNQITKPANLYEN